mmetsp:Transcript_44502/g.123177  ORF Transcript_44502/g.123177 Transcript_44502/m.123177 type:complete len:530 (+) Transcript_44502:95-1684(+)|eukprot:CAMPEP_0117512994 /NCGR_PEP_ID=MMETSP0784-20121206/29321_1 /TAXON_ID=39447 /ORGANISM="" /LENGTH=529 /DNA_ID=CAMNT_0005308737 /DNA_START=35 /DNA_END=1624 /DNA_ORIENTATION=+
MSEQRETKVMGTSGGEASLTWAPSTAPGSLWSNKQMFLLAFNAAVGGFLFGYDTNSMSASLLQIRRPRADDDFCPGLTEKGLNVSEQQTVVSFVVLGAFLSATASGSLNAALGRRNVILVGSFLFMVGALMMAFARGYYSMLVARIVAGLGVGISSHTVPLYISECSPANLRGSLCFLNDLMIVVGQIAAAAVSTAFFYGEVVDGWRWILGLAALPSVMMFVGFFVQPESPRWLVNCGKVDEARKVLKVLRAGICNKEMLDSEFDHLVAGARAQVTPSSEDARGFVYKVYADLINDRRVRRALFLGGGLQFLQQWCGINTIMYYGATVLQRARPASAMSSSTCFTEENKKDVMVTMLFACAQAAGIMASWFLVDRYGRRPLALTSLSGVAISLTAIGLAFSKAHVSEAVVIICVQFYLVSFGVGMSPVPWTVNAEIYPQRLRAQCISISTGMNWAMNFIVSQTFLTLATALSTYKDDPGTHPNGVFFLYAQISVIGLVCLWLWMPETKGLTLEQIGQLFTSPEEARLAA